MIARKNLAKKIDFEMQMICVHILNKVYFKYMKNRKCSILAIPRHNQILRRKFQFAGKNQISEIPRKVIEIIKFKLEAFNIFVAKFI